MKSKYGDTPLHSAIVGRANISLLKFLLKNGANINAKDNYGWTPLHQSVRLGNTDAISVLLSISNIDIKIRNNDDMTAFELVQKYNHSYTMKLLFLNFLYHRRLLTMNLKQRCWLTLIENRKQIKSIPEVIHSNIADQLQIDLTRDFIDLTREKIEDKQWRSFLLEKISTPSI